jgi:hypothetical protein
MRVLTGPTVQLGLDLQYPAFRPCQGVLQLVGIHRRQPPGLPVLLLLTCCPPSPCTRLSRARTTTRTPPRPGAVSRRRACPPCCWPPHGMGGTRPLPTFTTIRSTSEPPSCTPAASPSLRRSPSRWPPHRHVRTGFGVAPTSYTQGRVLHPGPDPPDFEPVEELRGFKHWFLSYGVSSRLPDPHRLAVPARPVVVRAACHLPARLRGSAALSFTSLLRQTGGRVPFTPARS